MSQISVGQLSVDIIARLDKLDAGLRSAERKTKKTGEQIESSMAKASKRLDNFVAQLSKAAGIAAVLAAGFDAVTASIKLARGDIEGMKQTLRSIPLLGQFVQRGEAFSNAVFGVDARRARRQEEADRTLRRGQRSLGIAQRRADESSSAAAQLRALRQESALLSVSGAQRQALDIEFETRQRVANLRAGLNNQISQDARRSIQDSIGQTLLIGVQRRQALLRDLTGRFNTLRDGSLGRFGTQVNTRFQVPGGVGTPVKSPEARLLEEIKNTINRIVSPTGLRPLTELN